MEDMLFQEEEKIVQLAMEIIIQAGDARNAAEQAMDHIEQFDFVSAKRCVAQAEAYISKAHNVQTEVIQNQMAGTEVFQPNVLFNHAQDTLMTVMSEVRITKKLIVLFEAFFQKMGG